MVTLREAVAEGGPASLEWARLGLVSFSLFVQTLLTFDFASLEWARLGLVSTFPHSCKPF